MGYLRLLVCPRIAVLWVAQTLSAFGDRLYGVAMMWLIWQATHRPILMGLVAVAECVPFIAVGWLGRRMMARCGSLRALAIVDLARAGAVGTVPVLWHPDAGGVLVLLVSAALVGGLGAVFDPNLAAIVPGLVDGRHVQPVTGLLDLTGQLSRVAGYSAAGTLLVFVSEVGFFAVDAVTFVVSAVALFVLGGALRRTGRNDPRSADGRGGRAGRIVVPRAWPLLRAHRQVGWAIGVHAVATLCAATTAIGLPILIATTWDAGAGTYGLILGAAGAGALAGNVAAGNVRALGRFPRSYAAAWMVGGVALAAMGAVASLPALAMVAAVSGACGPVAAVALNAHLGRQFDHADRLRLMAADQTAIRAAGLCGMVAVPLALTVADVGVAFSVAGAVTVGAALAAAAMWLRSARITRARPVADSA